ncbi:MAG: UvrD-helicase domain-containing protein, partial [Vibrio sp.]|nr:UvrD-helicase domain-containing protein [Vibrio sp.]
MTPATVTTPLNTLTFPLHGARLIEASAGTGKTFTIAGLYLRLLLGHGDAKSRHQAPLTVDQILVVTFTEAATAELRDRIRRRIHEARIAFSRGFSDDPVI